MASIYYPAGCEDVIPDHICDPCEDKEKAKIGSVAYVKSSFAFSNISNPVEWQAGIVAGNIIIIPAVIGSFDGGAEVESAGYGRQSSALTGYNFSANYKDPNYKNNAGFYNALKNSRNWKFAYVTSSQVHLSDNTVSVVPKNPVSESMTDDVVFDVTVKWAGNDLPEPADVPPGIFDECIAVA